jgi:hypothetical protein
MPFDPKSLDLARKTTDGEGLDSAVVCVNSRTGIQLESVGHANNKVGATEAYARGFSWVKPPAQPV